MPERRAPITSVPAPRTSGSRRAAARRLAWVGLAGFAIASPWSLSASEAFVALALIGGVTASTGWRRPGAAAMAIAWGVYLVASIVAGVSGPRGAAGVAGARTLLWGLLPFATAAACRWSADPPRAARRWAWLWLGSMTVAAGADLVGLVIHLRSGGAAADHGAMTASQLYLAGSLTALAFALAPGDRRRQWWAGALFVVLGTAMAWQLKRGAWASWVIGTVVAAAAVRRWKVAIALVVLVVATFAVPAARDRWMQSPRDLDSDAGSRGTLWTSVAPWLVRDFPAGVGPGNTSERLLHAYDEGVEPGLSHLHCTPLQILAESGVAGLLAWAGWFAVAIAIGVGRWRVAMRAGPVAGAAPALAAWVVFLALFVNGWVEFNFGDTEVALASYALVGWALGLRARSESPPPTGESRRVRDGGDAGLPG